MAFWRDPGLLQAHVGLEMPAGHCRNFEQDDPMH